MVKDKTFVEVLKNSHKKINYIFLGVGLTILVMNLTAFLSFVKDMEYSFFFFNLSVFSSILIILYSMFQIFEK